MIFDRWENFVQASGLAVADAARIMEFMSTADDTMPAGTYELDGRRCRAVVSHYDTKVRAEAKLEYHKKFIDVQTLLSGRELLLVTPEMTPDSTTFGTDSDCGFREMTEDGLVALPLKAGRFALLPVNESHAPGVRVDARHAARVCKVVFKIAAD